MAKPPTQAELFATVDEHVRQASARLSAAVFMEKSTGRFLLIARMLDK